MRNRKTRDQKACTLNKPFMGNSERDRKFGRHKLAFREGAGHVLLLFVLGLVPYFHLIISDRPAVSVLAQGHVADIPHKALEETVKMS